jgi:hypothetical protein
VTEHDSPLGGGWSNICALAQDEADREFLSGGCRLEAIT